MSSRGYESLADIMREDEARRLAEAREEIAREQAEWDAMSDEQRAEVIAKREAKYANIPDCDDDLEDEDDDEDEEQ